MRKVLFLVSLIILMAGQSSATDAQWMSFDGQERTAPHIQATRESESMTRLNITVSGVETTPVTIEGEVYNQIRIPGHWFTLDEGMPELPFITSSLILPDEGTPVVRVLESSWREMGTNPVLPSRGTILRTEDPATIPYTFGPAYQSNKIFPKTEAELYDPYILRDFRGVSLRINAVRWDPARSVLLVLESMTLEVETKGSTGINIRSAKKRSGLDSQFANLYNLAFDNYDTTPKYNMVSVDGRMLVVCHDSFVGTIQPFVDWKRSLGMGVQILTTGSVGGTTSGIQSVIDSLYAEPEGLTYVILVGDQAQVPSYSGTYEGADDDTRYGNIEGDDLYPDLFVSRISGSNPDDIQTQINKFIRYERDPDAGGDWYHVGAAVASSQGDPSDTQRAGLLRDDMLNYTFTEVYEIYQPEGNTADISSVVNTGVSLVNYLGHGTGTSWTNPAFTAADIQALSNGWKTPWILDVSCSNGDFSTDECFAEAWMRAGDPVQPQGALATYSASTTTPWVPPCVMQAEAVDLLVADQANVLGALYFSGIMKVMDIYPGNSQLVEQYNIFGDCSLMVRTSTPVIPAMLYDDVLALGTTVYSVDTGLENTRVALYSEGLLRGVGETDVSGHVDVVLTNPVDIVGPVTMTVTGYNLQTQVITLHAEVPLGVDIDPVSIPVSMATKVTISLAESTVYKSVENVTVTVEGVGVPALEAVTNAYGVVTIEVNPEFGEVLRVRGVGQGLDYDYFNIDLPVHGALDLTNAAVEAEVATIGMEGTLAPNFEGTITGTSDVADFDLKISGPGLDSYTTGTGNSVVQNVTPLSAGTVFATLLKRGFNIYEAEISVVPAYGTLSGTVTASGGMSEAIEGVRVYGFVSGDDPSGTPLFDLVTDAAGLFTVPVQLPSGDYDLYAWKFAHLDYSETFTLFHGVNDHNVIMGFSPVGVLSGAVTAFEEGEPVSAGIQIFRADNDDLMASVNTDELGLYTCPALPFYDYHMLVTAYGYEVQDVLVSLANADSTMNFSMASTDGKILLINSNSVRKELQTHPPKLGKNGVVVAEGYTVPAVRSASDLVTELGNLNFTVDQVESPGYVYGDFLNYDLVLVTTGGSGQNLSVALKDDLETFVAAGGKLLIEGGELGYNNRYDTDFCANVLHMLAWKADYVSNLTVTDAAHAVMSQPNIIAEVIDLGYSGYADSDNVIFADDARGPASWDNMDGRAGVICYDPNPAPEGGQIVYFSFNFSALDSAGRGDLLQNSVDYLMVQEFGQAVVTGQVVARSAADQSGATLTLDPGHATVVTGSDGSFIFENLVAGAYQLKAERDGFASVVLDLVVPDDQTLEQMVILNPIITNSFCNAVDIDLPDNDQDGIFCTITVEDESILSGLRVFLDISHTSATDLEIDLISPSGFSLRLHQNQPGTEGGLVGWYPEELNSAQDLAPFLGEQVLGDWQLLVIDQIPGDLGHVNNWCLELSYESHPVSSVDEDLPQVLALDGNYPNPFNPQTVIRFSVPDAGNVDLRVHDVRGVRVRTLVSDVLDAGHHEVTWMGRDDRGRAVASGAYFYRLSSGGKVIVGKMLLVK